MTLKNWAIKSTIWTNGRQKCAELWMPHPETPILNFIFFLWIFRFIWGNNIFLQINSLYETSM